MAITLEKLRDFRKMLEQITIQTDSLISQRDQFKLFKNVDDYKLALEYCHFSPQDYYKFRLFDTEIELHFNFRSKKFYIQIETLRFNILRLIDYQEFISKYKLKPDRIKDSNLYFEQEINFEEIVRIYNEFCIFFLKKYNSQDKLFYYE